MLTVLLIFALIRALHGVPLASPSDPPDPFPVLTLRDTQIHFGQRTVNDIVISCFATIFACTWSAAHPNIPAVTDSAWTCFKRRVTIMIYALLAPEMMTMWAIRQRVAAKEIMDQYNQDINGLNLGSERTTKGWFQAFFDSVCGVFQDSPLPPLLEEGKGPQWTLAHGFFLQMGGFMLCESGIPVQTLLDNTMAHKDETKIIWNIQHKVIDPPRITEEDIKDRSKGDAISKIFIILQTTWFIVQCIARWSQRLPVTELEVVTLGFAMLNGITYGLWWDKPQNVGRPVFLERKKPREEASIERSTLPVTELEVITIGLILYGIAYGLSLWWDKPQNVGQPVFLECKKPREETSIERSTAGNNTSEDAETESNPLLQQTEPGKQSWLRRKLHEDLEGHASSLSWRLPSRILLQALVRPLMKMLVDDQTVTKMRVGMFYAAESAETEEYQGSWGHLVTGFAIFATGLLFGSVHLIPSWFLHFPSHQEKWLWRVSAIIITAEPVLFMFGAIFSGTFLEVVFGGLTVAGLILYPISRIILLTLSLSALRSLPSGALQTIEWTTFIPHL